MADPFVDTDVLIRLLTGDDLDKQARAAALFEQVEAGTLSLAAPDTVIADAVYVLASPRLYHVPRAQIRDLLSALLRYPHFKLDNRRAVLRALELYATYAFLDFGDALIAASMEHAGSRRVYSFDTDFDRIPAIERIEP